VEIYQNCVIFNDDVYKYATDKAVKADNLLYLEHGKPMIFGKDKSKGIPAETGEAGGGDRRQRTARVDDLPYATTQQAEEPPLAYLLSRVRHTTRGTRAVPGAGGGVPERAEADLRGASWTPASRRLPRRRGPRANADLFKARTCGPSPKSKSVRSKS
jgi:2-oxoglutarate ferredoxin oxidoreductase subunit beta